MRGRARACVSLKNSCLLTQLRSDSSDHTDDQCFLDPLVTSSDLQSEDCLFGLVVKGSASRTEDPGFDSRLRHGDFSRSSHTSGLKNWLSSGYPGSALGLVGPVSIYFDWVR